MLPKLPILNTALRMSPWLLLLWCLRLVGCASLDTQAEIEDPEPEAQAGEPFRKPGPPGQMLGIDERAREIERNLGVR